MCTTVRLCICVLQLGYVYIRCTTVRLCICVYRTLMKISGGRGLLSGGGGRLLSGGNRGGSRGGIWGFIKNVKRILKLGKNPITAEIFPRDPNGDAYFSF